MGPPKAVPSESKTEGSVGLGSQPCQLPYRSCRLSRFILQFSEGRCTFVQTHSNRFGKLNFVQAYYHF